MIIRSLLGLAFALLATGCTTVEGGFRYEYDGKVFRADGRTPAKGVIVRMVRPDSPEAPDLPDKLQKQGIKYVDRSLKVRADHDGKFIGVLETVQGWKYSEFMGMHTSGPTKPPEPPMLPEVIIYVQEHGSSWMGYKLQVPPEAQSTAISGIRKVHVPDLLLPAKPTTQATTTTAPVK